MLNFGKLRCFVVSMLEILYIFEARKVLNVYMILTN